MYYDFDGHRGSFILAKKELLFVPAFKALHEGFGWDAIQYLFYFSSPLSPYYHMEADQRDAKCREAIEKLSWEHGRKLPEHLNEKPLYKLAEVDFSELDKQIEAEQESSLHRLRSGTIRYMNRLNIESSTERKEIIELLGTLDTVAKQHRDSKKALTERLATDDQVAVTPFDD